MIYKYVFLIILLFKIGLFIIGFIISLLNDRLTLLKYLKKV